MMRVFRFYPPGVEEQRAFLVQLTGAILSFVVIGVLLWQSREVGLRGVLLGAGAGVLFLVARSAWQLEQKAARSQQSEIGVEEAGFHYTNSKGAVQFVPWQQIEAMDVRGGRLQLTWRATSGSKHELEFGAREIEDGMELIRLLAAQGKSTPSVLPPDNQANIQSEKPVSNFIPLEPK